MLVSSDKSHYGRRRGATATPNYRVNNELRVAQRGRPGALSCSLTSNRPGRRRSCERNPKAASALSSDSGRVNAFWFVLVGVLLIAIALLGRFLDRLPVSPAMIYLLVGVALGPAVFNAIELHPLRELAALESLSEVARLIARFTGGI